MTGSLNRKLQDPKFREKFEHRYRFFQLEVQILNALEDKGWTYEDLAKKVETPITNKVQEVQDTLQKGLGFLSPHVCQTSPDYNKMSNQFNPPQFNMADYISKNPLPLIKPDNKAERDKWNADLVQARKDWNDP